MTHKYTKWQRIWPTALTFIGGWALAAGAAWACSAAIQDHDTSVIVAIAVGMIGGIPVGLISALVWELRSHD
jgi:hypothetical protein